MTDPTIQIQVDSTNAPSMPSWFGEVVLLSQHLTTHGLLDAFAQQIRLMRGHFGIGFAYRFSRSAARLCHQRRTDPG